MMQKGEKALCGPGGQATDSPWGRRARPEQLHRARHQILAASVPRVASPGHLGKQWGGGGLKGRWELKPEPGAGGRQGRAGRKGDKRMNKARVGLASGLADRNTERQRLSFHASDVGPDPSLLEGPSCVCRMSNSGPGLSPSRAS